MYKLSDVAKKLNVEKVLLFEMLLTKGEYLEGNVEKKYGVTYLSDDGIDIIGRIIRGEKVEIPQFNSEDEVDIVVDEELDNENLHLNKVVDHGDNNKVDNIKIDLSEEKNEKIFKKSEINNHNIEIEEKTNEVKNLELLTNKSKFLKFEKDEKRNKISKLRNDFIILDSEIRRKQEALESYDKILEEDIQWVAILEDKLSVKLKEATSDEEKDFHQKKKMEKMFFKK